MRLQSEVVVVGGGPGGLVASVYLRRYKRDVVLVRNGTPRARWIPRIRNLVGYSDGLTGLELLDKLDDQAMRLKPRVIEGCAVVRRQKKGFLVDVDGCEIEARKVILATGIVDKEPPLPNFEELKKKGVLGYCPICDGYDHSEDPVALLVGDRHGLEKIKFVAKFSPDLHLVLLNDVTLTPKYEKEVARLGIPVYRGLQGMEFSAKPKGAWMHFKRRKPVWVRLAYVGLGVTVTDSAFRHLKGLRRTKEGYLLTSYHQETSIPGLYAIGDCVNALAQVSVAVGHAAIAATRVHNELGF